MSATRVRGHGHGPTAAMLDSSMSMTTTRVSGSSEATALCSLSPRRWSSDAASGTPGESHCKAIERAAIRATRTQREEARWLRNAGPASVGRILVPGGAARGKVLHAERALVEVHRHGRAVAAHDGGDGAGVRKRVGLEGA